MIGIYRIKNLVNNKCYYGSSKQIEKRLPGDATPSPMAIPTCSCPNFIAKRLMACAMQS